MEENYKIEDSLSDYNFLFTYIKVLNINDFIKDAIDQFNENKNDETKQHIINVKNMYDTLVNTIKKYINELNTIFSITKTVKDKSNIINIILKIINERLKMIDYEVLFIYDYEDIIIQINLNDDSTSEENLVIVEKIKTKIAELNTEKDKLNTIKQNIVDQFSENETEELTPFIEDDITSEIIVKKKINEQRISTINEDNVNIVMVEIIQYHNLLNEKYIHDLTSMRNYVYTSYSAYLLQPDKVNTMNYNNQITAYITLYLNPINLLLNDTKNLYIGKNQILSEEDKNKLIDYIVLYMGIRIKIYEYMIEHYTDEKKFTQADTTLAIRDKELEYLLSTLETQYMEYLETLDDLKLLLETPETSTDKRIIKLLLKKRFVDILQGLSQHQVVAIVFIFLMVLTVILKRFGK